MEILIAGAVVALVTGAFRWLAARVNKEVARSVILIIGAAIALVATIAYQQVPQEMVTSWLQTWGIAIGAYEVVYKTVIKPALEKAGLL